MQFPWESEPGRTFPNPHVPHRLQMPPLWVDAYPVTNHQFAQYLSASNFTPVDREHWLEHWGPAGTRRPPAALEQKPVTHVSLNDARAFCAFYGKRLPAVWEWQWVAGQASDMRPYPWGIEPPSNATCPPHAAGVGVGLRYGGTRDVDELPADCSPHGVCNAVGNVWQYTSEFQDQHTRSVVLKGGSNYRPSGSVWYLPQTRRLDVHQKYLLMSDGYERAGTIGFRCVADAKSVCRNLCGQQDLDINASSVVDLTVLGSEDWLAFSNGTVERKKQSAGAGRRLIGFSSTSHTTAAAAGGPALRWSDGQPDKTSHAQNGGIASVDGFDLTVAATAAPSVLTLFLGGANTALNLSARLSDGSAPVFQAPQLLGPATSEAGVDPVSTAFQFRFRSANPNATLNVNWRRARGVCDRCHMQGTCLCAESGEQTPPIAGLANLTAEAANGGTWISMQTSSKVKNLPTVYSKAGGGIPLDLAFINNGTVGPNMTRVFGSNGVRIYGPVWAPQPPLLPPPLPAPPRASSLAHTMPRFAYNGWHHGPAPNVLMTTRVLSDQSSSVCPHLLFSFQASLASEGAVDRRTDAYATLLLWQWRVCWEAGRRIRALHSRSCVQHAAACAVRRMLRLDMPNGSFAGVQQRDGALSSTRALRGKASCLHGREPAA